jgi:signal transduction histidine kinase/DNA-binding response OmpR family regulator
MSDCFKAWNIIPVRSAIIAASAFIAGHIALSLFLDGDSYLRILLSDIIHPVAAGLATCCLILAASRSTGQMHTAWGFMAAALFSATLADITWAILETGLGTPPFPSLADAFYLMFYPLFALGILLIPVALQSPGERITRLLDTGVVMIAATLIIWSFLISPNMEASTTDVMTLALSSIYPAADLLLFFAIVQIAFQKIPATIQRPMIILAISSIILIFADSFFSIMSLQGTFVSGGMVDTAYVVSYALIGLAGLMQARSPPSDVYFYPATADNSYLKSQLILFLPLAAAAAAYVLLIWGTHHEMPVSFSFLAWGAGAIMGLILVRQTVLLKENRSLCSAAQKEIAERKAAEEALLKAKEAADSAARSKSDFLASMSHEIRTPLTAVLGMSELMLDTPLNDEQHEFMETIYSSSKSLLLIISDILDFSKIEANKLAIMRRPMEIISVVENAMDVISTAAANKDLEIICDIDEDVPKEILGDSGRLTQILVNLMGNAVKFTEKGEVLITVSALKQPGRLESGRCETSKMEIMFAVKDTGMGIPEDRMDRLFQSFSQADPSVARIYGGTGLGLAICKSLVEMMGGRIWVQSKPGKGSTFYFTIMAEEIANQDNEVFIHALSGKRLLIAANSNTIREALSKQTTSWGMTALAVSSGAQVMELMKGCDHFDIVILDQALLDMDASNLARSVHEMPGRSSIPLLIMKSLGNKEINTDIMEMLVKPIKPSQLHKALQRSLFAVKKEENGKPSAFDARLANRYPLRILVAEDNPINLKVVTRTLSKMGYRPDIAISGLEVIGALKINRYDLILMDIQMPDMDGIEGTKTIRALHPGGQNPRIVAMTALVMEGDKERCLEAGMDDYLSKPVRMDELVAVLERSSLSREGK